jgi:leucyl aminopeptidase
MHVALGNRQSGVFASTSALAELAVATGVSSGERMCMFPLAEDYLPALDSKVADIKQCTLDGEADHILAALFLQRFTNHYPWIHVDLSASRCNEGLGAVASEITGFGVKWGAAFLVLWAK